MKECSGLRTDERAARQRALALAVALTILAPARASSSSKVRLRGYITGRVDDSVVLILDDRLETTSVSRVVGQDSSGEHSMKPEELAVGMLVDAEGQWMGRHKFFPEKITVDLKESEKRVHGTAYLQEEPAEVGKIAAGDAGRLKLDGYLLQVGANTKREWNVAKVASAPSAGADSSSQRQLAACHVKYTGIRRKDGTVEAEQIDLGPPAPADAYKMPHGMEVVQSKDSLTGTDILEFRQGKKVQGRMKLLEERSVREYVSHLGDSLLPAGAEGTSRPIEFRFFVVEDPTINAAALPDGTLLINTGLLGAMENESQLAFVMSHEMAHVLQAHYKREVDETRGARVGLTIAGLAAGAFIGDMGTFMAELGIASVVNGHQRELENQADRLGLQNVIEHGYDPREAPNFSRVIINRYGDRSTSKLWSNHDSSLIRGSFLAIQLQRAYPDSAWEGTKKNTPAFQKMKEDLGPVKIM
jgi:hypothetical protein